MNDAFLTELTKHFPQFAEKLLARSDADIGNVAAGASSLDLAELESRLGIQLPESYKTLLRCGREFWLFGGSIQFSFQHPFFHDFQTYEALTPQQKQVVKRKSGGAWPPPSQGMLCFAEFFMEADGDQVLFDVTKGMTNGEYPVMYYDHEDHPPSVRKLADDFVTFIDGFLDYEQWAIE
ncbi:SMI1 / KNR4 family protein [Botrimarina colliarenosi]|uniref:SMI1 / KNR4 family protein n=1 Tax=Botrimarina colliarenosi TaxID=2528001 RepID=A0A5C6A908_9BACT|nr:SMI1/KNR4 family protein [Botrimarina colliarenosi]TWT96039.1 SMI1 / KNR4 family protein [Botrimarina colliarenosi]